MERKISLGRGRFNPSNINNCSNEFIKQDVTSPPANNVTPGIHLDASLEFVNSNLNVSDFLSVPCRNKDNTGTWLKPNNYLHFVDDEPDTRKLEDESLYLNSSSDDDRPLASNNRLLFNKSDHNLENRSIKNGNTQNKRYSVMRYLNKSDETSRRKSQENSSCYNKASVIPSRVFTPRTRASQKYSKTSTDYNKTDSASRKSDGSLSSLNLSQPNNYSDLDDSNFDDSYSDNSVVSRNTSKNDASCVDALENLRLREYGSEYTKWWRCKNKIFIDKIKEVKQDLFNMPDEYSLAHCVAEDMNMSAGIAVSFRNTFKHVAELLNQRQTVGGLAVLQDKERFIYYLVTKRKSSEKPTYHSMYLSLSKLRQHIIMNSVKKLAIPAIGCGLDKLDWKYVKSLLQYLFEDTEIEILVCKFSKNKEPIPRHRNCKTIHVDYPIEEIQEHTIIIYLSSADSYISETMSNLDNKFNFIEEFTRVKKRIGDVILYTENEKFVLCGCIVQQRRDSLIDFVEFHNCVSKIQHKNKMFKFNTVAFQIIISEGESLINRKLINILRNTLKHVTIYICGDTVSQAQADISVDNCTD